MKKILSFLFQLILGLMYLTTLCVWIIIPDEKTLNIGISLFTFSLTLLYFYLNRKSLSRFANSSWFKNFATTFISAGLILSILGLLNYLAFKHPWEKDLTTEKLFSLSPQSIQVVKNLKSAVNMDVYARQVLGLGLVQFLKRYSLISPQVNINLIDPELNPRRAEEMQITKQGQVVIYNVDEKGEREGKTAVIVSDISELGITNALIKLSRNKTPQIYFTSGHRELNLNDEGREGLSKLRELLTKSFYDVKTVNLLKNNELDSSVDTLVIWGPKEALFPQELDQIKKYMEEGGHVVLALMPELNSTKLNSLRDLFNNYGLHISNNMVFDAENFINGSDGSIPLVSLYDKHHLITKNLDGQTFFPFVSSIEKSEIISDRFHFFTLFHSGKKSYSKSHFGEVGKGNFSFNQSHDELGPHALAAGIEEMPPFPKERIRGIKIVAFGNATFLSNMYWGQGKNVDLFLNTLVYSTEEGELLTLERPSEIPQKLVISAPHYRAMVYFSILLGPLIFLSLAVFYYRRRVSGVLG